MENIQNYYERAVSLLASQFQIALPNGGFTNFQGLLNAILTQATQLQTQIYNLDTLRSLNSSQGIQLDGLGQILGLPRMSGQSDQSYQQDLIFQIFVNGAFGTPEQVIFALKYLTDATKIWYLEVFPAAYIMATNGEHFPTDPGVIVPAIQVISPAGVNFVGVTAIYNTVPFVFSNDPYYANLLVAPNPLNILELDQLLVNPGTGTVDLQVNAGQTTNPNFGGGFAETDYSFISVFNRVVRNIPYSPIITFNILEYLNVLIDFPDAEVVPGTVSNPLVLKVTGDTLTDTTGSGIFVISPGSVFNSATIDYTTGIVILSAFVPFVTGTVTVISLIYYTVDIDATGAGQLAEEIQM